MRRADLKERSSVFLINRAIIVIVLLVISSLSFALGYFVGKSTTEEPINTRQSLIGSPPEVSPPQPVQHQALTQPGETAPQPETGEVKKEEKPKETQQVIGTQKPQVTQKPSKAIKYTVQVGAFGNASDAESLKAKLDKKGYKAYLITPGEKKDKGLYKVRVGEFKTRKEAEVLSAKIKKAMGLQTFVTFKTQLEELR